MPVCAGDLKTAQLLLVEGDRDDEFPARPVVKRVGIDSVSVFKLSTVCVYSA